MEKEKMTGYPSIDRPWLKYYRQNAISEPLPECTIYEHIFQNNQDNLDRIALNYYGRKISYEEMFRKISDIAGALENIGVKMGDVVTVCTINSPETVYLIFALNKIGVVANMIYGSSTGEEIEKYIENTKSKIVFTLDMFQDKFLRIANKINVKKLL